jgi:hypothetical protein
MVLLINGVPLEESPGNISQFFLQYPHFKESAGNLCSMKQQVNMYSLTYFVRSISDSIKCTKNILHLPFEFLYLTMIS